MKIGQSVANDAQSRALRRPLLRIPISNYCITASLTSGAKGAIHGSRSMIDADLLAAQDRSKRSATKVYTLH